MMSEKSFTQFFCDVMHAAMREHSYEPEPRIKEIHHVPRGKRNLPVTPHNVRHQYPIKNGKNAMQLMAENISNNNALLSRLKAGK
jgi:hypothetical protein